MGLFVTWSELAHAHGRPADCSGFCVQCALLWTGGYRRLPAVTRQTLAVKRPRRASHRRVPTRNGQPFVHETPMARGWAWAAAVTHSVHACVCAGGQPGVSSSHDVGGGARTRPPRHCRRPSAPTSAPPPPPRSSAALPRGMASAAHFTSGGGGGRYPGKVRRGEGQDEVQRRLDPECFGRHVPPDGETETVGQHRGVRGFIGRAYRPAPTSGQKSRGTGYPVGPARCWQLLIAAGLLLACECLRDPDELLFGLRTVLPFVCARATPRALFGEGGGALRLRSCSAVEGPAATTVGTAGGPSPRGGRLLGSGTRPPPLPPGPLSCQESTAIHMVVPKAPENVFHSPCPFCPPTLSLNPTLTLMPTPTLSLLLTLPPNLTLDPNQD